jgi:hypothetical protein
MFKASSENFLKMYFSGLRVKVEVYLMDGCVIEWFFSFDGASVFLVSPETYHKYLKFVEKIEKNKTLLTELR